MVYGHVTGGTDKAVLQAGSSGSSSGRADPGARAGSGSRLWARAAGRCSGPQAEEYRSGRPQVRAGSPGLGLRSGPDLFRFLDLGPKRYHAAGYP